MIEDLFDVVSYITFIVFLVFVLDNSESDRRYCNGYYHAPSVAPDDDTNNSGFLDGNPHDLTDGN